MTVIASLISNACVVHVTDSNLSAEVDPGHWEVESSDQSKIVRVDHFLGAIAYFGYAASASFDVYEWLKSKARETKTKYERCEVERFARDLTKELNSEFTERGKQGVDGIGIHFIAYEVVGDSLVPELFYIHNWTGGYLSVASSIICERHTYFTTTGEEVRPSDEHRKPQYRNAVRTFLDTNILRYNNGAPALFNPASSANMDMVTMLSKHGYLKTTDLPTLFANLTIAPVESVCKLFKRFAKPDKQIIGGNIHYVIVTPTGDIQDGVVRDY